MQYVVGKGRRNERKESFPFGPWRWQGSHILPLLLPWGASSRRESTSTLYYLRMNVQWRSACLTHRGVFEWKILSQMTDTDLLSMPTANDFSSDIFVCVCVFYFFNVLTVSVAVVRKFIFLNNFLKAYFLLLIFSTI